MENLIVQSEGGKDVTTSLIVAEVFGKRHDSVLRDIENLSCSQEFNAHNFVEIEYSDTRGRKQRAYQITKDGFSFLVMGYTGEKAGQFKETFIKEFNKREALLKNDDFIVHKALSILSERTKLLEADLTKKDEIIKSQALKFCSLIVSLKAKTVF